MRLLFDEWRQRVGGLSTPWGLAAVGEFGGAHAGDIAPGSEDLTLTSYLFGPRYTYRSHLRLAPFGEALVGLCWLTPGISS